MKRILAPSIVWLSSCALRRRETHACWLALVLAAIGCMGCASSGGDGWRFAKAWRTPRLPWQEPLKPEPQQPERLVATWTDATHNRPGETPQRGFGGRLVFFGEDQKKPIRVDGQLVVYAFDETDRPAHDTAPTRRYVIPTKDFSLRESDSKMGPSYSVWLPWDRVGGPSRKISLIARFEPRDGGLLLSEQTHHYLPGPKLPTGPSAGSPSQTMATTKPTQPGVQTASYETGTSNLPQAPADKPHAAPTTIALSPRLVAQLERDPTTVPSK